MTAGFNIGRESRNPGIHISFFLSSCLILLAILHLLETGGGYVALIVGRGMHAGSEMHYAPVFVRESGCHAVK